MNWGKGLAIAMALFIGFIVVLVVILMRQDVDLVAEDYYKNEIEYQDEINARVSGNSKVAFEVSQIDNQVVLRFNEKELIDSISIQFWRPNNDAMDRTYTVNDAKMFIVPANDLEAGNYTVRCQYWNQNETYVQQTSVQIKS